VHPRVYRLGSLLGFGGFLFKGENMGILEVLLSIFAGFWVSVSIKLAGLIGLIVLDVVTGIALALRLGVFKWSEVGNFYKTMVLPFLLGWAGFAFVSQWVTGDLAAQFGDWAWTVGEGITTVTWLATVAVIGNSILTNGRALYGDMFGPKARELKQVIR
jgi:hypothetical protein